MMLRGTERRAPDLVTGEHPGEFLTDGLRLLQLGRSGLIAESRLAMRVA